MKLSWLSTSEAYKHTSMYMIWQSKAMHKVKRECKSQWIKHKQRDLFRDSSTQLYVPAFTQKDFQSTNLPHRTPTQGTSTEDLEQYKNQEYTTLLSTEYNLSLEGYHNEGSIQLGGFHNHKLIFPQK